MQDSGQEFRDSYHTMIASLLFAVNYDRGKTFFIFSRPYLRDIIKL